MIEKMQAVERALERWQRRTGRLPEEGGESDELQTRLSALAGRNAYAQFEEGLATAVRTRAETGSQPTRGAAPPGQSDRPDEMAEKKIADDEKWQYIKMTPPATPVEIAPTAVKIKVDLALSQLQMSNYLKEAPSTWHEAPGTIIIVHNTERFFLVWGAGVDGRPLKAAGQSGPLLLTRGAHTPPATDATSEVHSVRERDDTARGAH